MKTQIEIQNMTISQIINYFNSLLENNPIKGFKQVGPKGFNTKSKAIERTVALQKVITLNMGSVKKSGLTPVKSKGYKMAKIRSSLLSKGIVSNSYLANLVGSTSKNIHVMVSILCNPSRVKNPISVKYDRKNKIYQLSVS